MSRLRAYLAKLALVAAFLTSLIACLSSPSNAAALYISNPGQNWLFTNNTGSNLTIDADHTASWLINVAAGQSVTLYGGSFALKTNGGVTDDIYLDLYACAYKCGSPVSTVTVSKNSVSGQFTSTLFQFSTPVTISGGGSGTSYYAFLHSNTSTSGNSQYGFKYNGSATVTDGVTAVSSSTVTLTENPTLSPSIALTKTSNAANPTNVSTSFNYTINLGNNGGYQSGTTVYVYDQLPSGVSASSASSISTAALALSARRALSSSRESSASSSSVFLGAS